MKLLLVTVLVSLAACAFAIPLGKKRDAKNVLPLDDGLIRNKIFPLAAGAYSDKPEDCIKNKFNNATIDKAIRVVCGTGYQEPENCFGYTALLHTEQVVVLAYRGTHGFIQLMYEFDRTAFKDKINTTAGGQVGNYFYSVYSSIMDAGLRDAFNTLVKKYPNYDIWITGHSLGGSLASIAALEMIARNETTADKVKLFTFGQPRTGDTTFAAIHDKVVPVSYRITHDDDVVPHMPYEKFEDYYHHKSEIWYNNRMKNGDTYIECDEDESDLCSDGAIWKYSVLDHLYYYGKFVTGYGFNGCV